MRVEFPSEKVIEDYVWGALIKSGHCPISGESVDLYFRQKEIKGYGVTDIIKVSFITPNHTQIIILELKNESLKEAHVAQLCRYMAGVRRIARLYSKKLKGCHQIEVLGELAGPLNPERGDFVYLIEGLEGISIYDVSLSMEKGFVSEQVFDGWFSGSENRRAYGDEVRNIISSSTEYWRSFSEQLEEESRKVVGIKGDRHA